MLRPDGLIEAAVRQTGLDDLGDVPFRDALDVLVESLDREAELDEQHAAMAEDALVGLLAKRLRLVEDRTRNPSIADEEIRAPVVIVGLPRSGSTHLHALMGQVVGTRTPRFWEMSMPSPPPETATFATDPRIAQVEAALAQTPDELQRRHPFAARRPEQCNLLNDWAFINQTPIAQWNVPTYRHWLLDADHAPAYEAHRRTLQHLQWRTSGRWVLKYPKHLFTLDALLSTYPDAVLVWTHRDPAAVVPSAASLTSYMRAMMSGQVDLPTFGREWALLEEVAALRGTNVRDAMADEATRVIDVHYHDLVADPIGTVGAICEFVGLPYEEDSRQAVSAFLADDPRDVRGRHRYSAATFGLDAGRLRHRFGFYIERFGVRVEEDRS